MKELDVRLTAKIDHRSGGGYLTVALAKTTILVLAIILNTILPYLPFATQVTASATPSSTTKVGSINAVSSTASSTILKAFNSQDSNAKPSASTMASDLASLNDALATGATDQGISLNLDNSNVAIVPTSGSVAAASITSNVKTALPGYSLTIKTDNTNNSLTNTTDATKTISSTDGTITAPKVLNNNQWGYAMARDASNSQTAAFDTTYGKTNSLASKWAAIPASNAASPATIKHTETTPDQTNGDNTTVYYGLNLQDNSAVAAGTYQANVTYTATANILDPPVVEQITPDTIKQSVSMGGVATGSVSATSAGGYSAISRSAVGYAYTCYLTDKGSVYCATQNGNYYPNDYYGNVNYYRTQNTLNPTTAIAPSGKTSTTNGWLKVNTGSFDGTVVQIATGSVSATSAGGGGAVDTGFMGRAAVGAAYMCYLTDKGSVYCATQNGNYYPNDYIENVNYYETQNTLNPTTAIAPSGKTSTTNGWLKVNTGSFDGSVSTGSSSTNYNLTITGSKFAYVNSVYVDINKNGKLDSGEECASLKVVNDAKITCAAPAASPGTYDLYVINPTSQTRVSITYQ